MQWEDKPGTEREPRERGPFNRDPLSGTRAGDGFSQKLSPALARNSPVPLFTPEGLGVGLGGPGKLPPAPLRADSHRKLIHAPRWPPARALHPKDSLVFLPQRTRSCAGGGAGGEPASPVPGRARGQRARGWPGCVPGLQDLAACSRGGRGQRTPTTAAGGAGPAGRAEVCAGPRLGLPGPDGLGGRRGWLMITRKPAGTPAPSGSEGPRLAEAACARRARPVT